MIFEKHRYNNAFREQWDAFVSTATNGTFLHTRAFYEHNPKNIEEDHSLIFLKKDKIAAIFPAIVYQLDGRAILHSHGRSTYGGIIVGDKVGVEDAVEIIDQIIAEAKDIGAAEIIIRNPFRIFYETISDESDYAMWYRGFRLKSRELEIYIDLRDGTEAARKRYENSKKYHIKKAAKFITVRESEDLEQFWPLLEENLAARHEAKPVHTLGEMQELIRGVGNSNVRFFGAYHEDKLVGGMVVFVFGKLALHSQYTAQDANFQEFRPVTGIIDHVIEWGAARGYRYFNLGMGNEDGGKVINSGLFHFKGSFGGRGVLRETMHLTLDSQ
jgi:hypothetical protein